MPRQQNIPQDPLSPLIQLKTSSIFQMQVSLQSLGDPWRHHEWTRQVSETLGVQFVSGARRFFQGFHGGCDFSELIVDAPDHHDIPGFMEYLRSMSLRTFAFYILGRLYTQEQIPEPLTRETVLNLVKRSGNLEHPQHLGSDFNWAEDTSGLREKLLETWETYWQGFFSSRAADFPPRWESSLQGKSELLEKYGGTALLENVTGLRVLPPCIPEESPYHTVEIVPVCVSPRRFNNYYGYGRATIVFDCERTNEQDKEAEKSRLDSLAIARALSDSNRLRILKLIARDDKTFNGRRIASKLELSPSVVSRHLNQLKRAGLIEEESVDNRNITYRLKIDRLGLLPDLLLRYFKD